MQESDSSGITHPKNLEEQAISLVSEDIYEKLVKGYTEKQWGRDCKALPAFIIRRLPVRFTFDNHYFNALYQGIPIGGYTKLAERMLEGMEVHLNVAYLAHKQELDALADAEKKVIFGGRLAEYRYYDMDQVVDQALRKAREILA